MFHPSSGHSLFQFDWWIAMPSPAVRSFPCTSLLPLLLFAFPSCACCWRYLLFLTRRLQWCQRCPSDECAALIAVQPIVYHKISFECLHWICGFDLEFCLETPNPLRNWSSYQESMYSTAVTKTTQGSYYLGGIFPCGPKGSQLLHCMTLEKSLRWIYQSHSWRRKFCIY